jgi:hypothetical protein
MSQKDLIQASFQVEAPQELAETVWRVIQNIVRGVRSLRVADSTPEAAQSATNTVTGPMQGRKQTEPRQQGHKISTPCRPVDRIRV